MEEIRQKLIESGVIGRVVENFHPRHRIDLLYDQKKISLGDEVWPVEVKGVPQFLDFHVEDVDGEMEEMFENSTFVLVMTDPDSDPPGGEYLHWLISDFAVIQSEGGFPGQTMITYEPPKPMRTRMMVFTFFKKNAYRPIAQPISRENFSTRAFAHTNELGPPLSAGFFYVKNVCGNGN